MNKEWTYPQPSHPWQNHTAAEERVHFAVSLTLSRINTRDFARFLYPELSQVTIAVSIHSDGKSTSNGLGDRPRTQVAAE